MTGVRRFWNERRSATWPVLWGAAAVVTVGLSLGQVGASSAEAPVAVPPPAKMEAVAAAATSETAVLAGGCFWGVQAVFQHVNGVTNVLSGYAGGKQETANYPLVSTGQTGHAESVEIVFDPRVVNYGTILQVYFSVAHDPTQLNRQGPDSGTQYRSAIFCRRRCPGRGRAGLHRATRSGARVRAARS